MRYHITKNNKEKPVHNQDDFHSAEDNAKAQSLRAGLYLVATPIGNLRDISTRGLDTLRAADMILCEDTRVTRKLLNAYQIRAKTIPYHDHSDDSMREKIVEWLQAGRTIALVSDAGMPLISDPGYKLVQAVQAAGLYITSIPGANAPLAALQLSGLPSDKFCFLGFLPHKTAQRQKLLKEWAGVPATLMVFETASRLLASLADIERALGARHIAVVREITKMFEEVKKGHPAELMAYYAEYGAPKGEIVIVIAPPIHEVTDQETVEEALRAALKSSMRTKDAAALVAEKTGYGKKELYELALRIAAQETKS